MSNPDQVIAYHLDGLTNPEIQQLMPWLAPSSIRTYVRRARRDFTAAQIDRVEARRRERAASRRVPGRSFCTRRSLGDTHALIGRKLFLHRQRECLSIEEFCAKYSFSNRIALSAMEQGFHDFKLSELITLAKVLDVSIADLTGATLA